MWFTKTIKWIPRSEQTLNLAFFLTPQNQQAQQLNNKLIKKSILKRLSSRPYITCRGYLRRLELTLQ